MGWIASEFQAADNGTKITPGPRHKSLVELIHLQIGDQPKQIQEGWQYFGPQPGLLGIFQIWNTSSFIFRNFKLFI